MCLLFLLFLPYFNTLPHYALNQFVSFFAVGRQASVEAISVIYILILLSVPLSLSDIAWGVYKVCSCGKAVRVA